MNLLAFIEESNLIEGLWHEVTIAELEAYTTFLSTHVINPLELVYLVEAIQPGARLRNVKGLNVKVGNYIAPSGGAEILHSLINLLSAGFDPYKLYIKYQLLHPFTDGNGRSGRALWLHAMRARGKGDLAIGLGFLQCFHYATLERASGVKMTHG